MEAGSCKGEVEGAKLHKMAEVGSGGLKVVWCVSWENKIEGDLPLRKNLQFGSLAVLGSLLIQLQLYGSSILKTYGLGHNSPRPS